MKADTIVIFYYFQYHQRRDSTNFSHLNSLFTAWPHARLWYIHCQCMGEFIVLLYIYSHRTSDTWAQCSDISLHNHLRLCSAIRTSSSIYQKRDQYNDDDMIQVYDKLNTVDMRLWTESKQMLFNTKIILQNHYKWAVSSSLVQKKGCPNVQPHKFGRQLRTQIPLPDGQFGQSRAIGPMELLRPETCFISYTLLNALNTQTAENNQQFISSWSLRTVLFG